MKTQIEKRNSESGKRKLSPVTPAREDSRPTNGARGATRRTKELDRQDACPTTRRQLVAMLEEYGVSVHGFDGLRSDAYEKHLAGRSLEELEAFYGLLLGAGRSYKELAPECPKWGKEAKAPHWTTLQGIKERIRLEGRLADMSGHLKAFTAVAESLTGLPVAERAVVLQGMQALIAAELMRLTIEGGKVLDHLPAVDRAIRAVSAQARGENMEARVKLDAERLRLHEKALEIQNEKLKAEERRQKKEEADDRRRRKAETEAKAAAEAEPARKQETPSEMIMRIYGKNPFVDDFDNGPEPVAGSKAETNDE